MLFNPLSDFNTPSEFPFLKKENGGFDCHLKPPHGHILAAKHHLPQWRFFFITAG